MDHIHGSSIAPPAPPSHQYPGMMPPGSSPATSICPNLFTNYPLKGITHPHHHDVLCGRGGQSNSHAGNAQWRMLVAANKELYVSLPKKQKMLLAQSIVNAVRSQNPPGRFLQKDVNGNNLWYDVGDKRAQEKTSQALREGAPEIRTKLHPTTISPNPGAAIVPTSSSYTPVIESEQSVADSETSSVNQDSAVAGVYHQPKLAQATSSASIGSSSTQPTRNYHPQVPPQAMYPPSNPYYQGPSYPPQNYISTMAPETAILPSIPAQGPVIERKSNSSKKKERQQSKESVTAKDESNGIIKEIDEIYVPDFREDKESNGDDSYDPIPVVNKSLASNAAVSFDGVSRSRESNTNTSRANGVVSLDNFDDAPIEAPPRLETNEFSFGSVYMTDAEQARLMTGCSFGTTMSYGYTDNQNIDQSRSKLIPSSSIFPSSKKQEIDEAPLPVDGGLEPVGLSFGSVMSFGTTCMDNAKLEGAGFSFGSAMSFTRDSSGVGAGTSRFIPEVVDGGLQDIGTSFGSLTLCPGEKERIIESAKDYMLNNLDNSDDYNDATTLPRFKQAKSKGSLLECSDTDSEDDEASSQQLTAQKSAQWEKMQAVLAGGPDSSQGTQSASIQNGYNANQTPYFMSTHSQQYSNNIHSAPIMLNIPKTNFARDQSQMSAISANDDFPSDYDHQVHHSPSSYQYMQHIQHNGDQPNSQQHYQPQPKQHPQESSWYDAQNYSYQQHHSFQQPQYIIPSPVDAYYNDKSHQYPIVDHGSIGMMPPPAAPRTTDNRRHQDSDSGQHCDVNQHWNSDFDSTYVQKGNALPGNYP